MRPAACTILDADVLQELGLEPLEPATPHEARASSIAIAEATRTRTCHCVDTLDVREEGSRLECGRCGAVIHRRRT